MSRFIAALAAVAAFAIVYPGQAISQEIKRRPIPSDHPLVGEWRIDVPGTNCYEIYRIKADGTSQVSSGQEAAESEFEMSAIPSKNGFYKWIDKIVKDNGKPDCTGEIMQLGHVATNFILLHPSGDRMLMCDAEDINSCIGPFIRQKVI